MPHFNKSCTIFYKKKKSKYNKLLKFVAGKLRNPRFATVCHKQGLMLKGNAHGWEDENDYADL